MKKYISLILVLALCLALLCACGAGENDDGKLSVVTTVFAEYDWVMQILGDKAPQVSVTMLLDSGVDLHSFQPTADDLVAISACDLFIYVGGESDAWVEDALKSAANDDMTVIKLLDAIGDRAKQEESVEGMEPEDEPEGEPEYDEHIWLSLKNAAVCCEEICAVLSKADPDNSAVYGANAKSYIEKLNALDEKYASVVLDAKQKTLLFADRFPFRYLTEDYGLSYYAAFSGCSAESEASFETVAFLAGKLNELKLGTVLTIEGSDSRIAETVISTAGSSADIRSMDSMQSVTASDVEKGASYLAIMEKNLEVLKAALN